MVPHIKEVGNYVTYINVDGIISYHIKGKKTDSEKQILQVFSQILKLKCFKKNEAETDMFGKGEGSRGWAKRGEGSVQV